MFSPLSTVCQIDWYVHELKKSTETALEPSRTRVCCMFYETPDFIADTITTNATSKHTVELLRFYYSQTTSVLMNRLIKGIHYSLTDGR